MSDVNLKIMPLKSIPKDRKKKKNKVDVNPILP